MNLENRYRKLRREATVLADESATFITGKFSESAIYIANADGSGVMKLTRN